MTAVGKRTEGARKVSIRFFGDREVRAVWDGEGAKWWFSALDVVGAVNGEPDYARTRNYWKWLKAKLKREGSQLVSAATQLEMTAADGKAYKTDAFDAEGVAALARAIPNNRAAAFLEWFVHGPETLDEKSKQKAYALFESGLLDSIETGTTQGLQQIHGWLFGGLYDFAGKIRTVNIAKGGFSFAPVRFLADALARIDAMPGGDFDAIVSKYVEMNVAHPFREGNGRAMRIWLDRMLAVHLGRCVDWSRIDKRSYLEAMRRSVADDSAIRALLRSALTDRTRDRETFMKGIDYSYYYEQPEED